MHDLFEFKVAMNFNLFLTGDQHREHPAHYARGWEKFCHMVNSEYQGIRPSQNWVWSNGDQIDLVFLQDKRFKIPVSGEVELPSIFDVVRSGVEMFQPIRRHLIGMNCGNHERRMVNVLQGDPTLEICNELGCEYGLWTSIIEFKTTRRPLFRMFTIHGKRGLMSRAEEIITRKATRHRQLKAVLARKMGNCILMARGHSHVLEVVKPQEELHLYADGDRGIRSAYKPEADPLADFIPENQRWYVSTGSYLRAYVPGMITYVEENDYDPAELGFAVVLVRDGKIKNVVEERFIG